MGEYVPPFATIWTSESLDGIEAEMSYSCSFNVCNYACPYTSCPSYQSCGAYCPTYSTCSHSLCATYSSSGSPAVQVPASQNGGWVSGSSHHVTFTLDVTGAADIVCDAAGAYIILNAPGHDTVTSEDYMNTVIAFSGTATCNVVVSSKSGGSVGASFRCTDHLDECSDHFSTGAIWRHLAGLPPSGHTPESVVYVTKDCVEALKQLIRDDAALEFVDSVLNAGSSGAFEVAQAAATLGQMKLAAVCLVAGFVLSVSAPEPAIELIDEIEANMNSYTAGLRAYRYLDLSLAPRYEFESWNGQTTMYGVSRAVGGWSAVPSVQP